MNATIFSIKVPSNVDMDALDDILCGLERLCNTDIEIVSEITLKTASKAALDVLQTTFQGTANAGKPARVSKPQGGEQKRTLPAWNIAGTDEKFSQQSLNVRLRDHTLEPGTNLHHPKHGKKVVIADDAHPDGPYLLADPVDGSVQIK
jgi:hypothetical protein